MGGSFLCTTENLLTHTHEVWVREGCVFSISVYRDIGIGNGLNGETDLPNAISFRFPCLSDGNPLFPATLACLHASLAEPVCYGDGNSVMPQQPHLRRVVRSLAGRSIPNVVLYVQSGRTTKATV